MPTPLTRTTPPRVLMIAALAAAAISTAVPATSAPAKPKPKPKPTPVNTTKGQGQVSGANGQFGTVYSLQNQWNEQILGARYSIDFVPGIGAPADDEKFLVVDYAIKNAAPEDEWFDSQGLMTAIDQKGQEYAMAGIVLESDGATSFSHTLKPGQGLGQPDLHDPVHLIFKMPGKARITKLILNTGRLNHNEQVLRFYIAGATAAEAGANGDPANVVKGLSAPVRDPADPSGAVALATGLGGKPGGGTVCATGPFLVTLDAYGDAGPNAVYNGSAADDGKKYVAATITVQNVTTDPTSNWDLGGDTAIQLTDIDDDTVAITGMQKASKDEPLDDTHKIQPGAKYTFRIFFQTPTSATIKTLRYAAEGGRYWTWDLPQ